MTSFDYIYNTEYINDDSNDSNEDNKINLNINGYSLGGIFSQVFVYKLLESDLYKDKLNISLFNIESWFGGNEQEFKELNKMININNYYNKNSIFYYYNQYLQPYFNNIKCIEDNNHETEYIEEKFEMNNYFPIEIIKYINRNHFLSKIIK